MVRMIKSCPTVIAMVVAMVLAILINIYVHQ
jgi:hypothetical protein